MAKGSPLPDRSSIRSHCKSADRNRSSASATVLPTARTRMSSMNAVTSPLSGSYSNETGISRKSSRTGKLVEESTEGLCPVLPLGRWCTNGHAPTKGRISPNRHRRVSSGARPACQEITASSLLPTMQSHRPASHRETDPLTSRWTRRRPTSHSRSSLAEPSTPRTSPRSVRAASATVAGIAFAGSPPGRRTGW
jgi:hypothetical protein